MLGRKYESSLSNFFLHTKHTSKKSFIIIRADLCNLWAVNIYCFICFECFIYIEISVQICVICGTFISHGFLSLFFSTQMPQFFFSLSPTDYTDYHGFNFIIRMMNDFFDEILSLT